MSEMRAITGATTVYPLVGHPVGQVRTPPAINAWFQENGVDAVMVPLDVAPRHAASFFQALREYANCGGASVTVPHKQAAHAAMDTLSDRARQAGAVNIVRRDPDGSLHGDMTDGLAFVAALAESGFDPAGRTVAVIGAGGGAGAAITHALAETGAGVLAAVEPDAGRRHKLVSELERLHPRLVIGGAEAVEAAELVVNASPLGMRADDPLPLAPELAPRAVLFADIVTKPAVTPFLKAAEESGRAIQTGDAMAARQLEFQMRHLGLWPVGRNGEQRQ